jgi:hypothetical protein
MRRRDRSHHGQATQVLNSGNVVALDRKWLPPVPRYISVNWSIHRFILICSRNLHLAVKPSDLEQVINLKNVILSQQGQYDKRG